MTITITGTNDGPTISDVADIGFSEALAASAQDLSASGTVSFDDIDTNDVVDISTTLTTGAVWSGGAIDPALKALLEGGFTASVTDAAAPGSTPWSYTVNDANLDFLKAGETITLTYTLTATDSASATATDTVTITITGTNDAPTISDVANIGFTEALAASAQDLSASGTVSFDDIDTNDVVDISTTLTTGAVWSGGAIDPALKALLEGGFTASVTDAAAPGSTPWSYTVNDANLDFLKAGETITLTYTLTATDSAGATATDTVTITITGTNDGPTISDVADIGFSRGCGASAQDLSASGTVSFDDIDTNDVVGHQHDADHWRGVERRHDRSGAEDAAGGRVHGQRDRRGCPGQHAVELHGQRRQPGLPESWRDHHADLHADGDRQRQGDGHRHGDDHDHRHQRWADDQRCGQHRLQRGFGCQRAGSERQRDGQLRRHRHQRRGGHQHDADHWGRCGAAARLIRR